MVKVTVVLNVSNVKFGGGLQVAISVINSLIVNDRNLSWHFIVSDQVFSQIFIPIGREKDFTICNVQPSKPLSLFNSFKIIRTLELKLSVDVFFTLFGPGFYRPVRASHLIGFANAWLVEPQSKAYKIFPLWQRIRLKLKNFILKELLFNKNAFYVTETETVKKAFCKIYCIKELEQDTLISVANNCVSP